MLILINSLSFLGFSEKNYVCERCDNKGDNYNVRVGNNDKDNDDDDNC